jgi:uncharacterized protein YndB with AHSA1/START domain
MIPHTKTTIDRATFTITFHRTFSAPREAVFEAWTEPEQIKNWWDPTGAPLADCAVDLRPGGAFRFVTGSSHAPPFAGTYRSIERPAQLVFDAMGAIGTIRLETQAGATSMTVSIRCTSAQHLEQFLELGVDVGTEKTLDNLVTHVARQRQAS